MLIYDPDRLSRGEVWHRAFLESRLKDAGVTIEYLKYEQQDTPVGRMIDQVLSSFASYERAHTRQRMTDGLERRLADGAIWRSKPPYGWRYVKPTGKGSRGYLELVPEQAAVVREIFDLVRSGLTAHAIAGMLNARGLVNVSGGPWMPTAVQKMIHNPLHCGRPAINRYESVRAKKPRDQYTAQQKLSTRERPRAEWQHIELSCRIVSPEEQAQAEACLSANKRLAKRNGRGHYLLAGLIRCGCEREVEPGKPCGRNMYGVVNRQGRRYYKCNRTTANDRTISKCCRGSCHADALEAAVWDKVTDIIEQPDVIMLAVTNRYAGEGAHRDRIMKELDGAHAARDAAQGKLDNLLSMRLDGEIDLATYDRKQAQLVTARQDATAAAAHLEKELAQLVTARLCSLEDITAHCEMIRKAIIAMRGCNIESLFAPRQGVIRQLITAVWVYPDGRVRIEGNVAEWPRPTLGVIDIPSLGSWNVNRATNDRPTVGHFSITIAA